MKQSFNSCILIFVKAPQPGRVKSRLAQTIGFEHATELYKRFVVDLLQGLSQVDCAVQIWFTPAVQEPALRQWLGEHWSYQPQQGDDLGARLRHAFEMAFHQGYERVVAIGSDSPDLPMATLEMALSGLADHDAVIGPAADGGYYTIGFTATRFLPAAFANIPWSTEAVFAKTLARLQSAQRTLLRLPTWYDVDTLSELWWFYQHNHARPDCQTLIYLNHYRHEIFSSGCS